jgi:3-hexulose-6-phosphate synthase/6-phospho-3-hexuloisomerase
MVDLLEVENFAKRAKQVEGWGADYLCIHTPIDAQMRGKDSFSALKKISKMVNIPIAVAGGINSETAPKAIEAGASIVIVGGAITKSEDAREATRLIKKSIKDRKPIKTILYKKVSGQEIKEILLKVSTPNISDALHRGNPCKDIRPVLEGIKMVGRAFTVRTYPGDWAKPVEAVDRAARGDVIVIDAGGVPPAVWGELASWSAKRKGITGVVIDGAIRDVPEIKKLEFPAFAKIITPQAGEPKGLGEIGIPVEIGGQKVFPGDWIIGDDDGVIAIPQARATEIANRAMDVLEKENRIRKEIKEGSTLSQVTELLRWEKKR